MSSFRVIGADGIEGISSRKNYIRNASPHKGVAGYSLYADASATPVDGSGGSPTATWARSTSAPLFNDASFLFTPGSLGDGVAYDFDIDSGAQTHVLSGSFWYEITTSASFTDGDVTLWIYDVTNATLIQPSVYQLAKATGPSRHRFEFQAASNSTSYRLLIHQATSATGYTSIKIDNIEIVPSSYINGAVVSDWIEYTSQFTSQGFGTPTGVSVFYRRVGSAAEFRGEFTAGTVAASEARIGMPSALVSDSSKISTIQVAGTVGSSSQIADHHILLIEPSVSYFTIGFQNSASGVFSKLNGSAYTGNSSKVSFHSGPIPIVGWGAQATIGQDADTRVLAVDAYKGSGQHTSTGNYQDIGSLTLVRSDGVDLDTTTGIATIRVSGWYQLVGRAGFAYNATGLRDVRLVANGVNVAADPKNPIASIDTVCEAEKLVYLTAGQTVKVQGYQNSGGNLNYSTDSSTRSYLSIIRAPGPAQLAAAPIVALSAIKSTGSHGTSGSELDVAWDSYTSTHGSFDGTTFTVPRPDWYTIMSDVAFAANATGVRYNAIYIDGASTTGQFGNVNAAVSGFLTHGQVFKTMWLNAGQTVKIRAYQNSGGSLNYGGAPGSSFSIISGRSQG